MHHGRCGSALTKRIIAPGGFKVSVYRTRVYCLKTTVHINGSCSDSANMNPYGLSYMEKQALSQTIKSSLFKAVTAIATAILILAGVLLLAMWHATPPDVTVGEPFAEHSKKLGAPSSITVNQDTATAHCSTPTAFSCLRNCC